MITKLSVQHGQIPPGGLDGIAFVEHVSQSTSSGDASFGIDISQATLVVDVPVSSAAQNIDSWPITKIIANVLGYSKKNQKRITRKPPMRHPIWPWLWASKITSIKFMRPGKLTPSGGQYDLNAGDSTATKYNETGAVVNEYGTSFAAFKFARMTILFTTMPYDIRQDGEVSVDPTASNGEWIRFCVREFQPSTQVLTKPVGSLKWRAGPLNGQTVPSSHSQIVSKTRIKITWHQVPDDGLFDSGGSAKGGYPTNLMAPVGQVNDVPFLGRPIGTLLMESPELIPITMPCHPDILGGLNTLSDPPRAWNVVVNLLYFDPPGDGTNHGHNLLPHPTDGLWYKVSADGDATKFLYQPGNLAQAFWMN